MRAIHKIYLSQNKKSDEWKKRKKREEDKEAIRSNKEKSNKKENEYRKRILTIIFSTAAFPFGGITLYEKSLQPKLRSALTGLLRDGLVKKTTIENEYIIYQIKNYEENKEYFERNFSSKLLDGYEELVKELNEGRAVKRIISSSIAATFQDASKVSVDLDKRPRLANDERKITQKESVGYRGYDIKKYVFEKKDKELNTGAQKNLYGSRACSVVISPGGIYQFYYTNDLMKWSPANEDRFNQRLRYVLKDRMENETNLIKTDINAVILSNSSKLMPRLLINEKENYITIKKKNSKSNETYLKRIANSNLRVDLGQNASFGRMYYFPQNEEAVSHFEKMLESNWDTKLLKSFFTENELDLGAKQSCHAVVVKEKPDLKVKSSKQKMELVKNIHGEVSLNDYTIIPFYDKESYYELPKEDNKTLYIYEDVAVYEEYKEVKNEETGQKEYAFVNELFTLEKNQTTRVIEKTNKYFKTNEGYIKRDSKIGFKPPFKKAFYIYKDTPLYKDESLTTIAKTLKEGDVVIIKDNRKADEEFELQREVAKLSGDNRVYRKDTNILSNYFLTADDLYLKKETGKDKISYGIYPKTLRTVYCNKDTLMYLDAACSQIACEVYKGESVKIKGYEKQTGNYLTESNLFISKNKTYFDSTPPFHTFYVHKNSLGPGSTQDVKDPVTVKTLLFLIPDLMKLKIFLLKMGMKEKDKSIADYYEFICYEYQRKELSDTIDAFINAHHLESIRDKILLTVIAE